VTRGRRIATQAFDRYRFASMLLGLFQSIADLVRTIRARPTAFALAFVGSLVDNNVFIPVGFVLISAGTLIAAKGTVARPRRTATVVR
jgi:hypothetical protein